MTEADLKRTVEDYLLTLEAQGKLWFERLNSGSILAIQGREKRRIRLCREGTADYIVLIKDYYVALTYSPIQLPAIIFLELKGKTKQSEAQREFQKTVEAQGAEYMLIRSSDEVERIFE